MPRWVLSLAVFCGLFVPAGTASAQTAPILRVTEPLLIDGDVSDWSPNIPRFPLDGPDGHATLRLAADAANLYAYFEVRDPSPLRNSAPKPQEMLKGGDALGLYFNGGDGQEERVMFAQINGAPLTYVYRPRSEVKKPYVFASPTGTAAFDYVAPLVGGKVVFKPVSGGYVAEAALPWKGLGFPGQPKKFDFDAQVIFSDPAGTTNAGAVWAFTTGGPALTVEDLPSEARLYPETWGSAQLVDKVNPNIGSLSPAPMAIPPGLAFKITLPRAGRLSVVIQDEKGWIVRELVKAESRRAGVQTLEWDGRDRYGEVLPPGNYKWKALLFDGVGSRFLGSVGSSGRPPYRTPDGLGAIGGQHGVPTALASDEGGVYMAAGGEEGQPSIRKIDAKTGAALWKRSAGNFGSTPAIAAGDGMACVLNMNRTGDKPGIDLVRINPADGKDADMGDAKARVPLGLPITTRFGGMAIVGKKAFFSIPESNTINGIDLETGRPTAPITGHEPQGLYRADATHLLVCSGETVLSLDLAAAKATPVLKGLTAPRAVAMDAEGNYYVSELGEIQQIKKFDATGKLIATFGAGGEKPATQKVYDPLALQNISVLNIGPDDNLWLCESTASPRRFVKLTREGKWLEDFYGPVAYNVFGPDLDDFSSVYYMPGGNQDNPCVVRTSVDYAKYAADPNNPAAAWKIEAIYDLSVGADGRTTNPLMKGIAETGYGHLYVFTGANGKRYLFRPSKQNRATAPPGAGLWVWQNETWVPAACIAAENKDSKFSWMDRNGDGLPQDDEYFTLAKNTTYSWIRRDLTLDGFDGTLSPAIDGRGVPDYRTGKFAPYATTPPPSLEGGWTFFSNVSEGAVYYVVNWGGGRAMSFWDRADENRIVKVQNGVEQWVLGDHSPRPSGTQFSTVSTVSGSVDGILLAGTVEPANYVALTTDGFTLGNVLVDANGVKQAVAPNVIHIESFTGLFVKDPKSGKKVLFTVSSGDDRILEITGPGQMTRLEGEIQLDSSRPRIVEPAATTVIPYQSWYGNALRGMAVDGQDTEWQPDSRGVPLVDGAVTVGDVRFRRDAGALCLIADVTDSTPLHSGEGIEVKLGNPGGPAYSVFLTAQPNGELLWKGSAQMQRDGTEMKPEGVKVAAAPRWRGLGYRLEAEIPLELMPEISAVREQTFRRGAKDKKTGKMTDIGPQKAELPDLKSGVQLSAAVIRTEYGAVRRAVWPAKGMGVVDAP